MPNPVEESKKSLGLSTLLFGFGNWSENEMTNDASEGLRSSLDN